jgi:enoyl-CoA hydratase/carnithine racemase
MMQLDAAILRARSDIGVHVLVLRGSGDRFFCAGADIAELRDATPEAKYNFCLHCNETLLRLENTPKLTIAAINGHCVGGGFEVALACDLRVARASAGKIGLPEVQLGVLAGTGGTQRLARLAGRASALEWLATGELFSAAAALERGLISRVLPDEDFWPNTLAWASEFCPPARASLAVGLMKRSVLSGSESSLTEGLAIERELQQRLFTSADAREGLRAYQEKRPPRFEGR